jgi:cytoskeletal protein CcmA (bactofilin family)
MLVQNNAEKPITPADAGVALQPKPAENREATPKRDEAPTIPGAATDLLLGRGVRFEGKLTFAGTVRIDASFVGTIVTNDVLVVGDAARIDANITCGTIVVHGEVNGNIQAKTGVEIRGTAKVRGDLETPSLVIEKGAFFQGASRMDAAAKAARAKTAA